VARVNLTIDGRKTCVPTGTTIFEAAQTLGIDIPHLCHHPKLVPTGACRMCVVEVEGARSLLSSCTTPCADNMVVLTESERVIKSRKMVLDLLLANHPLDCLTCERTGNCKLQDYAYKYSVDKSQFVGEKKVYPVDSSNPFFERDYTKCIMCGQCVRVCDEVIHASALDYAGRGFFTKIAAAFDDPLQQTPCVFCGNCITACPVGALIPIVEKRKGRSYEYDKVKTVCPYCGVGCNLFLHVRDDKVIGVSPAEGPANEGMLCVKGRFGFDFLHHPDRLTTPLIRSGDGFREASWDEALDLVAKKFTEIRKTHGPDAFAGLASARCTNEDNYVFQRFMRQVLGTNSVDHCARLCHAPSLTGLSEAFGSGAMTNSVEEIGRADVVFAIGSNTPEAHPVIGYKVNEAVNRGATLIVADPRATPFAEKAHIHLQQIPGTDVALLCGMIHVILEEGLENKRFIEERTEGFAEMAQSVKEYTPQRASEITGVPAHLIVDAARAYASAGAASILYAMGITQHTTGHDNVLSIANLALVTGHIGRESTGVNPLRGQNNVQGACDMGALPAFYPGYQRVDNPDVRDKFSAAWGTPQNTKPGLTVAEMMDHAISGKTRAMYIMGENPMLSDPDITHVEEALSALEFLVVQDIFLTETARLADVVLPAAAFAEKDGTFTNTERRAQRIQKAVSAPGEAKPDWQITSEIAQKMGFGMKYDSASEITDEIAALTPIYAGITTSRLEREGLQWPCPTREHPGTKYLHAERFSRGLGKFSNVEWKAPAEMPDAEYPYMLTTGRVLYHYHTGSMTRRSRGLHSICPEGFVEIHPETAAQLGVEDGDMVLVRSRRGRVNVKALVTERAAPKVVFMPFHFAESAANVLTNPALDPVAKIPELKVCAVDIRRLESAVRQEVD